LRNKRYTNTTFTKRVDHDGGRRRGPRGEPEPAVCLHCGAVYAKRRWVQAEAASLSKAQLESARTTICPGCKSKRAGVPGGYLRASGEFLMAHHEEIERLLRNEAARAAEDNPLARIIDWEDKGGKLLVTTTTEHLAQRLGHALEKAFDGEVRYDFSHENKLARVSWCRG